MKPNSALLIVDVQIDFCPGGALAVPEGDRVVPVINRCSKFFSGASRPVFASRDWHPSQTSHFRDFGGPWPVHCVQHSEGARFHPDLLLPTEAIIISKGMDPARDDYSAFSGTVPGGQSLPERLQSLGIGHLYVAGLATDYCVKESVLEALRLSLAVTVITDAVRGVDLEPGDSEKALAAMAAAGAVLATSDEILGCK